LIFRFGTVHNLWARVNETVFVSACRRFVFALNLDFFTSCHSSSLANFGTYIVRYLSVFCLALRSRLTLRIRNVGFKRSQN